ncbi:MAG: hypothetical protein ACKO1M_08435 [Planctomycetota bacterium]
MNISLAFCSRNAEIQGITHIVAFGVWVTTLAWRWCGVDPDAGWIGPQSFSAFRRARGLKKILTTAFQPWI